MKKVRMPAFKVHLRIDLSFFVRSMQNLRPDQVAGSGGLRLNEM